MNHLSSLVSVIIPVYNVEKYIKDCLKSVVNQTYKNIEIIVVDDGSPDESYKIVESFIEKDERIRLIRQKNKGLNCARETGFKASRGEYIMFVDSDDILHPQFIEQMTQPLLAKRAEFSICQYQKFNKKPQIIEVSPGIFQVSRRKIIKRFLINDVSVPQVFYQTAWGKVFPRKMIEKIKWEKSNYRINEDEFFSTMIYSILRGKVAMVLSPMYFYRENPTSIMSSIKKGYNNFFEGKKISRIELVRRFSENRISEFPEFEIEILRNLWTHLVIFSDSLIGGWSHAEEVRNFAEIFEKYKDGFEQSSNKYNFNIRERRIFDLLKEKGAENISSIYDTLPKISIIVPIYNAEKYLEETLDSIKFQTFSNFEVILINDGSKDRSGEICDKFVLNDSRFKVFHKENGGVSRARNFGIGQALGEYITFVDADDILSPTGIESMIVEANNYTDVISAQITIKNGDNFVNSDGRTLNIPFGREFNYSSVNFDEMNSFMDGLNYPVAKLYRTDFIKKNKIKFPEDIKFGEDLVFVVKSLFLAKKIKAVEDWVYIYRRDDDNDHSATNSIANKKFDFALALRAIYDFLKKTNLYDRQMVVESFSRGVVMHSLYSLRISRGDLILNEEIFNFIKDEVFLEFSIDRTVKGLPEEQRAHFDMILENDYKNYVIWLMSGGYHKAEVLRCYNKLHDQSLRIDILHSGRGAIKNVVGAFVRKIQKEIKK